MHFNMRTCFIVLALLFISLLSVRVEGANIKEIIGVWKVIHDAECIKHKCSDAYIEFKSNGQYVTWQTKFGDKKPTENFYMGKSIGTKLIETYKMQDDVIKTYPTKETKEYSRQCEYKLKKDGKRKGGFILIGDNTMKWEKIN